MATKYELPVTWFNSVIASFVRGAGAVPAGTLWCQYGPLEVYLPPPEYIFVLKLLANRKKDQRDIKALSKMLRIYTRQQAQAVLDCYISDPEMQLFLSVPQKLDKLFPIS